MVTHDINQHMSQQVLRKSGAKVHEAHMNKFSFNWRQSETSWKRWLLGEVSIYQK